MTNEIFSAEKKEIVKAPKSTKYDLAKRIEHTEELLASGLRPREVVTELRDKYGIIIRTAQGYIHKAFHKWEKEALSDESTDLRLARRAAMRVELNNLYELSRKERNYKDCILILDRLCKLDNLYAPEQIEVTHNQGVIVVPQITTEADWLKTATITIKEANE